MVSNKHWIKCLYSAYNLFNRWAAPNLATRCVKAAEQTSGCKVHVPPADNLWAMDELSGQPVVQLSHHKNKISKDGMPALSLFS